MDIFFQDPSDIPLPPDEVSIRQFHAEPWPDQRRVRVYLEVTPFQKRPNGEIKIFDPGGEEAAHLTIVETVVPKMEFTVHLRGPSTVGEYTATATVYYTGHADQTDQDKTGDKEKLPVPTRITVVARAEAKFEIQAAAE
jgi:hypothetical protein